MFDDDSDASYALHLGLGRWTVQLSRANYLGSPHEQAGKGRGLQGQVSGRRRTSLHGAVERKRNIVIEGETPAIAEASADSGLGHRQLTSGSAEAPTAGSRHTHISDYAHRFN